MRDRGVRRKENRYICSICISITQTITCRKLSMSAPVIMSAVHRMDLTALVPESVDILIKIAPTHEEIVKFKEYELEHKNFSDLSEEDQFLAELVKIERFEHKIKIMSFMATFDESADLLEPVKLSFSNRISYSFQNFLSLDR
ncbi:unnamed protein product [Onchocerca flexuosa]|uniref:FH2 domain-containing protein n=1 Tax=Onchocerca flexuosa TaxID=387005 RepID=A0A183HXM2_9BILA|nr:unnamed protein product [Onchocerca flexuosa]